MYLPAGLFIWGAAFIMARSACKASYKLHANLLDSVFHLPMHFFDKTPTGRIVNRCSKDVETIDTSIPSNIQSFLECVLKVLSTVFIVSLTTPIILAAVLPLSFFYFFVQVHQYVSVTLNCCLTI